MVNVDDFVTANFNEDLVISIVTSVAVYCALFIKLCYLINFTAIN